jgi:putative ABC transport system permease protein
VPNNKADIDNFNIVEGNKTKSPGENQVWVNTGFADTNKIKIGDTLSIDNRDYDISAILVDTQFSSIMGGIERYWVKEGEIKNYSEYKNQQGAALAVRYKSPSSSDKVWSRFQKYLNGAMVGTALQYKNTYANYSTVLKFTGVFMLFFSIIIIITAIFIIKFVISNNIYRDYKNIGIYKALGFSQSSINSIYVMQYLIISVIASIIGIIFSKFVIDRMMFSTLKAIGMSSLKMSYTLPFISAFTLMILLITFTSLLSAGKTNKIKPVEAIREASLSRHSSVSGNISSKIFMKFGVIKAMAFKSIINNKKSAILIFVSILITLYSALSGVNLLNTTSSMGRNFGLWGFDNSMIDLKLNLKDAKFLKVLEDDLKTNSDVSCYSYFNFYQDASIKNKNGDIEKISVAQVLGDNSEKLGFMELQGRDPKKINEVSLSVNTSKNNDMHIGDYMEVYVKNKKYNLLVVGIYQSLNGMGKGIRLYNDTVKDADANYVPDILANLKDEKNIDAFIKNMKSKYGENIDIVRRQGEFDDQMSQMTAGSFISVAVIVAIMLSICVLNIFNITLMNINEEKKSFGIYKAIGMTSGQIRCSIMLRVFLIFIIALIAAVPLALKATPVLMSLIFINVGIAKYPLAVNVPHMIMIALVCFAFSMLSAYISSNIINKIKLRSLIED